MALTTLALLAIGALQIMTNKTPEPPPAKPVKPEAVAVAPPVPAPVPPAIAPSPSIIAPAPIAPEPQRPVAKSAAKSVAEPLPAPAPVPTPAPQAVPAPAPILEPPAPLAEPAPPVAPAPIPPPRVVQEARAKGDMEAMAPLVAPPVAKIDEPPLAPKPAPAPKPVQTPPIKAAEPVKPPPSAPKSVVQTRSIEKAPEPPKESAKEPVQEAPPPAALPAEPPQSTPSGSTPSGPAPSGPARPKPPAIVWPNLFGTVETRSDNLRPFTKWTWMLDRYAKEKSLEVAPCAQLGAEKCRPQVWRKFLAEIEGKSRLEQLEKVHAYMNQRAYIEDLPNYGVPDYWATPREFLSKDGDCEDYAIAKYMSLRHLGFKDEEMRVVVLQDMNLRVAHAVLVVYHEGKALLLDNQIRKVIDAALVYHYRPFFSINENFWWLHKAAVVGAPGGSPKG